MEHAENITLPAPVDPSLSVTCDALGRFVSMAWQEGVDRAASDGFGAEPSNAQTLAFKNAHKAQEQGDRVRAWIAAYPVQNASDLAQMTLTLVCGRKLASPMRHNERLSLRHAATSANASGRFWAF